ncbi:sensor histidine kinase [Bacillus sp. JJ722]|uniref:sensor histidine kinase n=1 Tax=Bacillus sp. JJ722 TaxID=3122973 RepID=UPI0030008685
MRHLWKNREKQHLHTSLTFDFFLFNWFLLILIAISVIFLVLIFSSSYWKYNNPKNEPSLEASSYINYEDHPDLLENLHDYKGWLEVLSPDLEVIETYGPKADGKNSYTVNELFSLLSNSQSQNYYYSITKIQGEDDREFLLLKIPRECITVAKFVESTNRESVIRIFKIKTIIFTIVLLLLMLVFNIIYSHWVAKRIKKPLTILTNCLDEMINGNYNTRLSLTAEKEFKQIQEKFNFMADIIETTTKARQELEDSKKRMIMDLSHDLKTPITSILGYAQALTEERVHDNQKRKKYLTYIYNKSVQVSDLIQNMLELLKLDAPDYTLVMKHGDLGDLISEVIADIYGDIEEKNFILHIIIPEKRIFASFDSALLSRAISNLVYNALQYNPSGTQLRIEVSETHQYAIIEVADKGVGIPHTLCKTVFDPFVRGSTSRNGDNGIGLGLSIVYRIIDKMGGHIQLTSSHEEATIFKVFLPK